VKARRSIGAASLVVVAALGACGEDGGGENAATPREDAGSIDGGGATDAPGDAPPVRAPFGLDTRPPNPTCKAPAKPPAAGAVTFQRVFANVTLPKLVWMAQAPGDPSHWYAGSLDGQIRRFPTTNPPNDPPVVLDLAQASGMPVVAFGEGGLLGFAFHPKFAQNGRLFVSWTTAPLEPTSSMSSIVSRFTTTDGGASFGQHTVVIPPFDQPFTNHKGGTAAFGSDGYLYLSFGDGGGAADAQVKTSFFAKILRIDVDTAPPPGATFVVPPDNPFVGVANAEPATFAYGFRNPFRFSIDRVTNDVWVGDVGEGTWEEVDAKVQAGGNYGWPCREGAHDSNPLPAGCEGPHGFVDPIAEHEHTNPTSIYRSITGGVVYRGKAMPSLVGTYVYGDFMTGEVWTLAIDPITGASKSIVVNPGGPNGQWVGFAEDADGEVYALSLPDAAIWKLVPNGPQPPSTFPDRLSKTGCVDPSDPKRPAPGVVPFAVNAPLWSDGADKERFFAVPDGKTIHVNADGDFDFPPGSVLVKTFSLAGRRVETRLFVRHDDGEWAGYTYEWLDDQSDAVLLPAGKSKKVGEQTWTFPSRSDCMRCHTQAAGRTLGPELGQLNGDVVYASTNRISNQLATLDHVGYFDAPLGKTPDAIVAYPSPAGAGAVEPRARAYLHANCGGCHRPTGPTRSSMDLRFATPLGGTKTCDVAPEIDTLGVAGVKLLAPGAPSLSAISLRVHAKGARRMPPLASSVVDAAGTKLLDDWIASVAACP
jgi:uncharacterized repeat protein (TIGR03806 family)